MRNKITGGIGMLWGSAIVVHWLVSGPRIGSAYGTGQVAAAALGAVMMAAGLYYFFKKPT